MSTIKARSIHYMGRESVLLESGEARAIIDKLGGMMPEFSIRRGKGFLNAHWIPDFRGNSEAPYTSAERAAYWKAKTLYILAGDFPCSPNFGPACTVDGIAFPVHGWTANEEWSLGGIGISEEEAAAFARFSLASPEASLPLSWEKCDILLDGQSAYYSIMRIKNGGAAPIRVNLARHNTVGSPFLQAGCKISLSADRFMTPGPGTDLDASGRIVIGAEFDRLSAAPLRDGGIADLAQVPGMIGYSDLITGAIPSSLALGWSCVVNPVLGLAYLSFFPGEAVLPAGEIALGFNDVWMQYGGRPYTPWSLHEGGADRTFCLGVENAVGAFANGLEYSLSHPEVLGRPTTVSVPAGGERKLCYGTALIELSPALLREGVRSIEAEAGTLVLKGGRDAQRVSLDASFDRVRKIEARLHEGPR
jgi:hypothetical protein